MAGRALIAALLALAAVGLPAGGTGAAFKSQTTNPPSTFTAAASFGSSYVKSLGTAQCGSTSDTLTVPAGGVPAGTTIFAVLGMKTGTAGGVSATDSGGNSYAVDVTVANTNIQQHVLRANVTSALAAGDTITVTHPSGDASALTAAVFAGVDPGPPEDEATSTGEDDAPTVSVPGSSDTDGLVGALTFQNEGGVTESPGWTTGAHAEVVCGGPTQKITLHVGYRLVDSVATWSYAPMIDGPQKWAVAIAAYG